MFDEWEDMTDQPMHFAAYRMGQREDNQLTACGDGPSWNTINPIDGANFTSKAEHVTCSACKAYLARKVASALSR